MDDTDNTIMGDMKQDIINSKSDLMKCIQTYWVVNKWEKDQIYVYD